MVKSKSAASLFSKDKADRRTALDEIVAIKEEVPAPTDYNNEHGVSPFEKRDHSIHGKSTVFLSRVPNC